VLKNGKYNGKLTTPLSRQDYEPNQMSLISTALN